MTASLRNWYGKILLLATFACLWYGPLKFLVPRLFAIKDLLVLLSFVFACWLLLTRPTARFKWTALDSGVAGYCLITAISAICASDSLKSAEAMLYAIHLTYLPMLLYWAVRVADEAFEWGETLERLVFAFMLIGAAWVVIEVLSTRLGLIPRSEFLTVASGSTAILDYAMGMGLFRPIGIVGTSHLVGYLAAAFAGWAYYSAKESRSPNRWNLFILGSVACLLSMIRTAWLALIMIFAFDALAQLSKSRSRGRIFLQVSGVTLVCGAAIIKLKKIFLFDTFLTFLHDYGPRLELGLRGSFYSPLFGMGPQIPAELLNHALPGNEFLLSRIEPDIAWITMINSVGWLGTGFFIAASMVVPALVLLGNNGRIKGLAAVVLVIAFCFFHYSPFEVPALAAVFWICLALLARRFNA